jgi:hypothetical protein
MTIVMLPERRKVLDYYGRILLDFKPTNQKQKPCYICNKEIHKGDSRLIMQSEKIDYITTPTDPPRYERRTRVHRTYAHVDCYIDLIKKYKKRGPVSGYAQYLL